MRLNALGVIAITSMLSLACTMTETKTTETAAVEPPSATPADLGGFRAKLALTKRTDDQSAITALARKAVDRGSPRLRARAGGAGGSCGLSTGDATCDGCLDASCCAENTACVSDADCMALVTCGDACTDDSCLSACFSAHPTGAALLDTLSSCVETSCAGACGGPSPPPSSSACGFASGDATCDACLDTNCCGAANACLGDADCAALLTCAEPCTDGACFSACEAAHPAGAAKLGTLSTCVGTSCGTACGGPPAGPGPASCGLTSGVATCDACLDATCCAETTSCVGDADCVALVQCYGACSDATCAAACDAAHPVGSGKLGAVATCVQNGCATPCGL